MRTVAYIDGEMRMDLCFFVHLFQLKTAFEVHLKYFDITLHFFVALTCRDFIARHLNELHEMSFMKGKNNKTFALSNLR